MSMPLDDAPQLIEVLLRRKGLAVDAEPAPVEVATPPHAAMTLDRRVLRETIDRITIRLRNAVVGVTTEQGFLHALDGLLRENVMAEFGLIAQAVRNFSLEEMIDAHAAMRRSVSGAHPLAYEVSPETRGMLLEALGLQEQLQGFVQRIVRELQVDLRSMEGRGARSPLGYMARLPLEVAKLILASQRGVLAMFVALDLLEPPAGPRVSWHLPFAVRLWRDGMRATARVFASACPEWAPEGLVSPSELLDVSRLIADRKAEDEWLASLIAAHPDQDRIAVYPEASRDDITSG